MLVFEPPILLEQPGWTETLAGPSGQGPGPSEIPTRLTHAPRGEMLLFLC